MKQAQPRCILWVRTFQYSVELHLPFWRGGMIVAVTVSSSFLQQFLLFDRLLELLLLTMHSCDCCCCWCCCCCCCCFLRLSWSFDNLRWHLLYLSLEPLHWWICDCSGSVFISVFSSEFEPGTNANLLAMNFELEMGALLLLLFAVCSLVGVNLWTANEIVWLDSFKVLPGLGFKLVLFERGGIPIGSWIDLTAWAADIEPMVERWWTSLQRK